MCRVYEDRVERCSGGGEARSEDRARIVRRRGLETVFIAAPQATLRHQAERRTAETPHPRHSGRIYIK